MPNEPGSGLPNEASYTVSEDTVVDNVTCLEWQKVAPEVVPTENQYDWPAAIDYCDKLTVGGQSDWRLPTRIELVSIAQFSDPQGVDANVFPGPYASTVWTSSVWATSTQDSPGDGIAWTLLTGSKSVTSTLQRRVQGVRCVRGGGAGEAPGDLAMAPENLYAEVASGEIKDNYTGLVWQQGQSDSEMPYEDSAAYCGSLVLGSHSWRLPSGQELQTLVDESKALGLINLDVFPSIKYDTKYWGAQPPSDEVTGDRISVEFASGNLNFQDETGEVGSVKCVR